MSDPGTSWEPGQNAVHRLIQLLDAVAVAFNRFRQLSFKLPNPSDPDYFTPGRLQESRAALRDEFLAVKLAVFPPADIAPHHTAERLANDAVAELTRAGSGGEAAVRDAAGVLAEIGWARLYYAPTRPDCPTWERFNSEGELLPRYGAKRAALLAALARVGKTVPEHIERRQHLAFRSLTDEGDRPTPQDVLLGWVAEATPGTHPPLPHRSSEPQSEGEEFARFLELDALAKSPEIHQVPFQTLEEYQRLQVKYGVYTVDGVFVGPPVPSRVPNMDLILSTDCVPVPGVTPRVCPRSSPKLPAELLSRVERRFRELGRVPAGETVLWVGRQAGMETVRMYREGCTCFAEAGLRPPAAPAPDEPANPARPGGRPARDANRPGRDRQDDILTTIRNARTPLTRPELVAALRLRKEGKLGHQLAWMVANGVLVNIPQRGYWPASDAPPE